MHDQAEKLRKRLKQYEHNRPARAHTIAVASGKGGVGKSNFTLNFSLKLSEMGKRVLLFDLDIGMGNIDILLGQQSKRTIVHLFNEHIPLTDIIEEGPLGLSYIAGGSALSDIMKLDGSMLHQFLYELQGLMTEYDYVLFDMGAGVTQESMKFILAADECIIVTTPEPTSITDGYAMMKHITSFSEFPKLSLVVNRAPSIKGGKETSERLRLVAERFLHIPLHPLGILPDDQAVMKAVINQVPYIIHAPKSKVSQAIDQIVREFDRDERDGLPRASFITNLKKLFFERS
ncbi:cobyrinic acid a,c-diamide synthase [Pontibacillus halophilus JSM 076056 = DSM 19796]|uniref:Cobyrinic acid a,c-diamide synthase n=1 Tax=Pontibacillus halophilus JSM 076056 = DSM 19796 TaxID=1385510 RepID=A0A0A5GMF0_9BACI|nr:MinD/ParA family protein [Pontibacillus halophilus]KGX93154.1 cobyrinic acid a,c-diamide synthase [Pontibacillus halophilus JSM 076056 = DSM 19796]